MKIKTIKSIQSVCGNYFLPCRECEVTDTDEQRQVYEVKYLNGFFEVPFQCAEAIVEPVGGEKCEFVTYNIENHKIEVPIPNLDIKFPKEWKIETGTEPQIERDGPKIKLLRALMSNCGQCKASDNLVLDIIHTDNEKQIYLCKGPFSEAVTYDVPFSYGELLGEEKPEQETPSKYHRLNTIKNKEFVDFYDIINLLQSNGDPIPPEIQHALKKLMYNDRGHKNMIQDKKEAVWSVNRWLENNEL